MYSRSRSRVSILFFVILFAAVSVSVSSNVPGDWRSPTLHLLWHDAYRLFPPNAFEGMRQEVESLFAANGIVVHVVATRSGQDPTTFPEPRVNAVLRPVEADGWNLGKDVMAAAIGEPGKQRNIFVFYPGVLRTLGHQNKSSPAFSPRETAELYRAMARVIAHELVHVLAPERGHAEHGLMSRQLDRRILLQADVPLDALSGRVIRAALEELVRPARRIAAEAIPSTTFPARVVVF